MAATARSLACVLLCALCMLGLSDGADLISGDTVLVYEWTFIDYDWPSDDARQLALDDGSFAPINNSINGIKTYGGVVYLTVPRWRAGVPATLTSVVMKGGRPVLRPFPSWEWQVVGNCSTIQYVQSMEIDRLGRMWIIDNGRLAVFDPNLPQVCAPKILVYDIKKAEMVRVHTFPNDVASNSTAFLNDIVIDASADDTDGWFAYISDSSRAGGIVVYDYKQDKSHRVTHPSMTAATDGRRMTINGRNYTFPPVPVNGVALSPIGKNMKLYYCALAGYNLYTLPTSLLKQPTVADVGTSVKELGRKASQSDGIAISNKGTLYYGALQLNAVYRWDTSSQDVSSSSPLLISDVRMQWPNAFAFDDEGYLWFVSNKLQQYLFNELNITGPESNFRVWKIYVGEKSYMYKGSGASGLRFGWGMLVAVVSVLYAIMSYI
ncbi:major royal jelly protein 1-like [Branchiostoma floridae]|uniref:Major royal jelly protein 1-like n=1 Tax=Branchiostoma floridae TaxID=7739 RepID=A0A9J7M404_BRAFL|nr:major royal jelly protein 1-like [Branchiostoma floridae]